VSGTAVSVIVPTCGNAAALERALTSILATRYTPLEVVVVENRPPALASRRLIEERFSGDPVQIVEEPRPGLSNARNAGLARAQGEVVAFADDDVVVDTAWIASGVEAFELASDVACVTGRILPTSLEAPGQKLFDEFTTLDKGPERREFRLLLATRAVEPLFPYTAGHIGSGANSFVLHDVALNIGGFDPLLGTGSPSFACEDLDFFIRLMQWGFAIVYDPAVIVYHDHPDSHADLNRRAFGYGMGLSAMLTKHLAYGPGRLDLLKAVPAGVRYLRDPNSRKNRGKSSDFPRRLVLLERVGMLLGPVGYGLSLADNAARTSPWVNEPVRTMRSHIRAASARAPDSRVSVPQPPLEQDHPRSPTGSGRPTDTSATT
jgi:GT2 family glycosyltransferase